MTYLFGFFKGWGSQWLEFIYDIRDIDWEEVAGGCVDLFCSIFFPIIYIAKSIDVLFTFGIYKNLDKCCKKAKCQCATYARNFKQRFCPAFIYKELETVD